VRSLSATSVAAALATTATTGLSVRLPGLIPQLDVGLTLTRVECVLATRVTCRSPVHVALSLSRHTVKDRRLGGVSLMSLCAGLGIWI
jgi:hypothetical protein